MPNHLQHRGIQGRTNQRPIRWMAILLAFLAVGGVVLALFWAEQADAQAFGTWIPDASGVLVASSGAEALQCEMVRIWPLPADCQFVFGSTSR